MELPNKSWICVFVCFEGASIFPKLYICYHESLCQVVIRTCMFQSDGPSIVGLG
jgi:hypothetical protein